MNRKPFTEDEIKTLNDNTYTFKATAGQLSFTKEFKELFWEDYCNGMTPSQILRKCGYNPSILGEARVTGIQALIKKEAQKGTGFYNGRRPYGHSLPEETSIDSADAVKHLQHEVKYLRQEVEFLKKISSVRNPGKQVNS